MDSPLAAEIEAILRRRPCDRWVSRLADFGVPCSPVNSIDAAFALAADLGLDPVRLLPRSDGRQAPTVANPIAFSRTPASHRLPPPELGADTTDVLERLESESE